MTRKKSDSSKPKDGGSESTALVPVETHARALARVPVAPGERFIRREQGVTLVVGRPYETRDASVLADEVYYVDELRQRLPVGQWLGEADKVSWQDPATGYECIMLRATDGGYLSGYVGVPSTHPLYGFDESAVPADIGIEVHGGLTYAAFCEEGPSPESKLMVEARRICHVRRAAQPGQGTVHATDYRVQHDDAWWFGFDCNHVYDLVPEERPGRRRFLGAEVGQMYRDDAYVLNEISNLAEQLKAIEEGRSVPPRRGDPLPPIGLDPRRGG